MKLYHLVPEKLVGTTLYPLFALKQTHPEVYQLEVAKYQHRLDVMDIEVPGLGVWGDVLHLSPVAPSKVFAALQQAGLQRELSLESFCVDSDSLNTNNLRVMTFAFKDGLLSTQFDEFNPASISLEVPDPAKDYYRDMYRQHRRPMLYQGITHVLYRGSIETNDLPVVTATSS